MLLREPSWLALALSVVQDILNITRRIDIEEETSIQLVQQRGGSALSMAEHGYVLENGKVVLEDKVLNLEDNPDVKESCLGLSGTGGRKVIER